MPSTNCWPRWKRIPNRKASRSKGRLVNALKVSLPSRWRLQSRPMSRTGSQAARCNACGAATPLCGPAATSRNGWADSTSPTNKGIHYLDVGTSGGVWGLERGYRTMIGGPEEAVQRLDPIFKTPRARQRRDPAHAGTRETPWCGRRRLHPLRTFRRKPFFEDGAQRNRVRHGAGLRRRIRYLQECDQQGVARRHTFRFELG